jgi:flagellar hook-basal body complex protein FliE
MSDIEISRVLEQMRAMAAATQGNAQPAETVQGADFASLLKDSVKAVNETQQNASAMATAFERGEPGVDLAQVMVEVQKASLSFEAVKQVRNRLLTAYQEIMRMPV